MGPIYQEAQLHVITLTHAIATIRLEQVCQASNIMGIPAYHTCAEKSREKKNKEHFFFS
jgi:hypothetical protein